MGSIGSGRHHRERRLTTEEVARIDIRIIFQLHLHMDTWRGLSRDHNCSLSLYVKSAENVITIGRGEEDTIDVIAQVDITWSPRNFGGEQPYFLCPNQDCGRRIAILYLSNDGIGCRHCSELSYQSQHDIPHIRMLRRAVNIRSKLGGRSSILQPISNKPRGMHKCTYDHMVFMINALEQEAVSIMKRQHLPQWVRKIELLESMT